MNVQKHSKRRAGQLLLALLLAAGLNFPVTVTVSPASAQSSQPDPDSPIGLISPALSCLAVNSSTASAAGQIEFNWSGTAQSARLVLDGAGTTAPQPVMVNGQVVGQVPADLPAAACDQGQAVVLDFDAALLRQGTNTIEIGDAGQPGNAWNAGNLHLEVLGAVQPASAGQAANAPQAPAVTNQIVSFTNHLDGSSQQAAIQLPDGFSNAHPLPLVLYAHTRYADMTEGADVLGTAANAKGWILATPQLHGHWPTPPSPPGAFAYASLESQYDIVGTIQYLLSHSSYNIDRSRIYLVGYSMGGQVATVTAAKYPDIFAALFDVKGPTDFATWYTQQSALPFHSQQVTAMKDECYTGSSASPTPQPPSGNMFCYHRRSSVEMAQNLIHEPISITHSFDDQEVPITHSLSLRDAINSFSPDQPAAVYVDTVQGPACPPDSHGNNFHHCYEPDPNAVMGFLNAHTLSGNQTRLNLVTDESKSYYWLNMTESSGNHWSYVEATANPGLRTVSLTVTDPQALTLGVSLGSAAIQDWAGLNHPGLGYPAATYHVKGGGVDLNLSYSSGYLTFTLPPTDNDVVTISPASFTIHEMFFPMLAR